MLRMAVYKDYYLFPEDLVERQFTWIHLGMTNAREPLLAAERLINVLNYQITALISSDRLFSARLT